MLETRIGISIFDRHHTGVRLTLVGQRFVDEALIGAQHFANALGAMSAIRRGRGGSLRLGMFTSLRGGFLRKLLGDYHSRYPDVECHFEEGTAQSSVGGVLEGRLDVAFVTGHPAAPRCHSVALWEEGLFVALRSDHPLAVAGEIDPAILRNERFIITTGGRGPEIEDFLLVRLSEPGFRPDIQAHSVSRESLLHMVELGFGAAIVTENAVSEDGGLVYRTLSGPNCTVQSSAIWLVSNSNPALRPLISLARRLLAE